MSPLWLRRTKIWHFLYYRSDQARTANSRDSRASQVLQRTPHGQKHQQIINIFKKWLYRLYNYYLIWLVVSTPLKNMQVSWDDYSFSIYGKIQNVWNHQPVILYVILNVFCWPERCLWFQVPLNNVKAIARIGSAILNFLLKSIASLMYMYIYIYYYHYYYYYYYYCCDYYYYILLLLFLLIII